MHHKKKKLLPLQGINLKKHSQMSILQNMTQCLESTMEQSTFLEHQLQQCTSYFVQRRNNVY